MQKYRPLILRTIAVLALAIIVATVVIDYFETGSFDNMMKSLPKMITAVLSITIMLVSTFYMKMPHKEEGPMKEEYERMTNGVFKPEDKKAKELFYRGFRAGYVGDFDSADYHYRSALKKSKSVQAEAFITAYIGRNAVNRKDYDTALELFKKATSLDRGCVTGWCQLMDLYMQRREFELAQTTAENAILFCPNNPLLLSRTGNCYILNRDYERALRDFREAQRLMPNSAICVANTAVAYAGLGRRDDAMRELASAKVMKYNNYENLEKQVQTLLQNFESRKIHYTGKFVLDIAGTEPVDDCTPEQLYMSLQKVWNYEAEFVILTPPTPIDKILFMQIALQDANNVIVQISIGENGFGKLHEKICNKKEAEEMFMNFITERKTPSLFGFTLLT